MGSADVDVLVVGAGASGLAAARTLQAAGREVMVAEAGARPGGVMGTRHVDGYRVEEGPNSFLVRAPVRRFLESCGAASVLEKAAPASRHRQLFHAGRLVDVPSGPVAMLRSPLLSSRAKCRVLGEPFIRRGDASGESVSDFIGRRLGGEVASALVGPFLTGVYAGDERQLGAQAVFPSLVDFERSHSSILVGGLASAFRRLPADERGLPGSHAGRGGMANLAAELASGLRDLRLETRVQALSFEAGKWLVSVSGPDGEETLRANSLILAVPAREAARLLEALDSEAAQAVASVRYAPIVALGLGARPSDLRGSADGFGFLVPRAAGLSLLGCLFMSQIFSERAPADRILLHCMLGGTRGPEVVELPDDQLVERAREDLDRTLGLAGEPRSLTIARWPAAVPQPGVRHAELVSGVRARLNPLAPIELAGSYLDGVSLADTFASGVAAADRMIARMDWLAS